jgi:hypothetical protein
VARRGPPRPFDDDAGAARGAPWARAGHWTHVDAGAAACREAGRRNAVTRTRRGSRIRPEHGSLDARTATDPIRYTRAGDVVNRAQTGRAIVRGAQTGFTHGASRRVRCVVPSAGQVPVSFIGCAGRVVRRPEVANDEHVVATVVRAFGEHAPEPCRNRFRLDTAATQRRNRRGVEIADHAVQAGEQLSQGAELPGGRSERAACRKTSDGSAGTDGSEHCFVPRVPEHAAQSAEREPPRTELSRQSNPDERTTRCCPDAAFSVGFWQKRKLKAQSLSAACLVSC